MNTFNNYWRLGYEFMLSRDALIHIIFIIVLIAVFMPRNWLKILASLFFFTFGFSITLTLGALNIIEFNKDLLPFLLPLSVVLLAVYNLTKVGQNQNSKLRYWLAGLLGLMHGFGFFTEYFSRLTLGDVNYLNALFPFNLGLILGELAIMGVMLLLMIIFLLILNKKIRDWNLFVSGCGMGIALVNCIIYWPW